MVRGVVCSSIVSSTGNAESLVTSSSKLRKLMRSFNDTRLAWHASLEATHIPTDAFEMLFGWPKVWMSAGVLSS